MPPPWERHLSEDDEQFYYYNPETGECLWETDLLEFLADEEFQNANEDNANDSGGEYSNGEDVGREAVDYDDFDGDHVDQRDERYDLIDDEDAPPPPPPDEDIDGLDLMALANMNVASSQASTSVYNGISHSSLSVVDRSKLTMRAKQQKINSLQQSREREQLRAQTAIPVTTRKAQSMQRSVEDMLQWEEERRQRLHRTKATLRAQEEAEVTGRPMLTKKAEEVSKRWREGNGDDSQSLADGQASIVSSARSVQDRLYEYEERKKEKMERLQAERDAAIRSSAIPKINPMSNKILERKGGNYYGGEAASVAGTSLGGESHVSERLYALAQLKQQTESLPSSSDATVGPGSFLSQGRLTQHDPSTGQRYFEPRLNPVSEAIATRRRQQLRHLKIEDVLHAQGEQYRRKLAEKDQRRRLQEEQKRKTSKVNALSAKIVEDKYIVSGETTQDRLARGIGTVRRRVLETIDQPTFKPKISESSLEILASSGYRHLYFQQQQQQEAEAEAAERRQRWNAAQELSFGGHGYGYGYGDAAGGGGGGAVMVEAGQVTLDPRVSLAAGGGGSSSSSSANGTAAGGPGNAVYERSRLWEQQRQRRLERDRHEAERREREICSFRPKVSSASAQMAAKGDIATRHQRWQQERDARLQSERQRQSVDEVKDCTFVPRVPVPPKSVAQKVAATRVPLVSPSSPSRSVESSSGHSGGGLSGHGSSHSQGHVSQVSHTHFGFEDFATPYTAFLPKSPTAAANGHKTVAASSSSSTQSASASSTAAAGGVRFRTKSASELLAHKAQQANLASPSEDALREAEHSVYSAPPTSTHRSSQGPGQQSAVSASSQFSFAEFPPSQLRYGASHHPPVAPPTTAAPLSAAQHWQQYYPHNAQLRELDDDDAHGALDYAADMTSLEQLAQLSLRQERQQFQQQQQQQHQAAYGYNPRSQQQQQRPPPHLMYHHDHDDAHSAAFDPEDML